MNDANHSTTSSDGSNRPQPLHQLADLALDLCCLTEALE